MTGLQLDQQLNVVLGFLQVFDAVLAAPAGHVLDDVTLEVADVVGMDVFNGLDGQLFVVVASNLHVEGGGF